MGFGGMRMRLSVGAIALLAGLGVANSATAQSLEEALAQAYGNNPTLLAKRAKLRATDEGVAQALSKWRPTVKITGDVGRTNVESNLSSPKEQIRDPKTGTLTVSQPIFRGGRTVAQTGKAENTVIAERAALDGSEQTVLLSAITAYVDNVQNQSVLELNRSNERVLERQLEATRDRFRVGEITRTDVSQAEARLAKATADRIKAEGDLKTSAAAYQSTIGSQPEALKPPGQVNNLPTSLEEVTTLSSGRNPDVISADYTERAAKDNVDLVFGEMLPTVSLDGTAGRTWRTAALNSRTETVEGKLSLTVPLYQAGEVDSRVREAKQTAGQKRLEAEQARRTAVETGTKAWENLLSARARIESYSSQIKASEVALEGVTREAAVGSRTVLDVLNAEQELLDARVNLVKAQRDEIVAAYQVRSAIGTLTAAQLNLPVKLYDKEKHYNDVRGQWIGTGGNESE
jgi:outer membrane protein